MFSTSPPSSSSASSTSDSSESSYRIISPLPRHYGSPVLPPSLYRRPSSCCSDEYCEDSYHPDCPDCQQPPVKRQREDSDLTIITDDSSVSGRASFSICWRKCRILFVSPMHFADLWLHRWFVAASCLYPWDYVTCISNVSIVHPGNFLYSCITNSPLNN